MSRERWRFSQRILPDLDIGCMIYWFMATAYFAVGVNCYKS